jgi:Dockerin type I domain
LSDGLVAGGNNQVLQLLGLTPNTDYVFTWFSPLWSGNTDRVGILDGSDDGIGQGMTIAVVQDADAELLISQYRYNTGDSTTFRMHFTSLTPGETLHHYAFTNELATELVASLPIAGDANSDGIIDLADFQLISDNFLKTVAPGTLGDVNKDGVVNAKDHRLWQLEYSAAADELEQELAKVPEPGTATLLCLWVSISCVARSRRDVKFCRAD